jgi:hypothetical protein
VKTQKTCKLKLVEGEIYYGPYLKIMVGKTEIAQVCPFGTKVIKRLAKKWRVSLEALSRGFYFVACNNPTGLYAAMDSTLEDGFYAWYISGKRKPLEAFGERTGIFRKNALPAGAKYVKMVPARKAQRKEKKK